MRRSVVIALALFSLLIITPLIDGYLFKIKYLHFIDVINKDQRIKIDLLEYHEGWFYSSAKIRLSLFQDGINNDPALNLTSPVSFILDEDVIHGPIVYDPQYKHIHIAYAKIRNNLLLSEPLKVEMGSLKTEGVIKIDTIAELNGEWRGGFTIPALSLAIPSISNINWSGLTGTFNINIKNNYVNSLIVKMQIGPITIIADSEDAFIKAINIKPSSYYYDSELEGSGLWSGDTNLSTQGLSITKFDNSIITFNRTNLNSKFGFSGDVIYNTSASIKAENIVLPNNSLPNVALLHAKLSVDNLSAKGVNSYLQHIKDKTTPNLNQMNANTLENLLVHTITPTSELYSEVNVTTPYGTVTMHGKSKWLPNASTPNNFNDIKMNLQTQISITASDTIIEKLVSLYIEKKNSFKNQIQKNDSTTNKTTVTTADKAEPTPTPAKLIQDIMFLGYMHKDANNYTTTISIEKGVLKINGLMFDSSKLMKTFYAQPPLIRS